MTDHWARRIAGYGWSRRIPIMRKLPGITVQDKRDIVFAREQGADFIALSFARGAGKREVA